MCRSDMEMSLAAMHFGRVAGIGGPGATSALKAPTMR